MGADVMTKKPSSRGGTPTMAAGLPRLKRDRERLATRLAITALQDLEAIGIEAWITGSLAKGRFFLSSDVDFVVNCPRAREYEAFCVIERAMDGFPFHIVPRNRILKDAFRL